MFDRPEKAVAAGQVVALFDKKGECCLGSGVIESTVTAE
jgi:tRNA U34 2-thiouridine synthase MnmA/TrmU